MTNDAKPKTVSDNAPTKQTMSDQNPWSKFSFLKFLSILDSKFSEYNNLKIHICWRLYLWLYSSIEIKAVNQIDNPKENRLVNTFWIQFNYKNAWIMWIWRSWYYLSFFKLHVLLIINQRLNISNISTSLSSKQSNPNTTFIIPQITGCIVMLKIFTDHLENPLIENVMLWATESL